MRKTLLILCLTLACCALLLHSQQGDPFIVKPYLQLGDRLKAASTEGLSLLWHAAADDAVWQVQLADSAGHWSDTAAPASDEVPLPGADPHRVSRAELTGLKPGAGFSYRVLRNRQAVFTSTARARKAANQPFSFVLFGDAAAGTPGHGPSRIRRTCSIPIFCSSLATSSTHAGASANTGRSSSRFTTRIPRPGRRAPPVALGAVPGCTG